MFGLNNSATSMMAHMISSSTPNFAIVVRNCFISELEIDERLTLACEGDDHQDDEQIESESEVLVAQHGEGLQLQGMFLLPLYPVDGQQQQSEEDIQDTVAVDDRCAVNPVRHHRPEKTEGLSDVVGTEDDQSETHQQIGGHHLTEILEERQTVIVGLEFLVLPDSTGENQRDEQQTMVQSEQTEGPVGTVPQTDEDQVDYRSQDDAPLSDIPSATERQASLWWIPAARLRLSMKRLPKRTSTVSR